MNRVPARSLGSRRPGPARRPATIAFPTPRIRDDPSSRAGRRCRRAGPQFRRGEVPDAESRPQRQPGGEDDGVLHGNVRGDVRLDRRLAMDRVRDDSSGRRVPGPHLHHPARLRSRVVLPLASRQRRPGRIMQPAHHDPLRQMATTARRTPRRLERPRPQADGNRHLFDLPDGRGVSRAFSLAAPMASADTARAGRERPVAAPGLPGSLPLAVRRAGVLGSRTAQRVCDQSGPRRRGRRARPARGVPGDLVVR